MTGVQTCALPILKVGLKNSGCAKWLHQIAVIFRLKQNFICSYYFLDKITISILLKYAIYNKCFLKFQKRLNLAGNIQLQVNNLQLCLSKILSTKPKINWIELPIKKT